MTKQYRLEFTIDDIGYAHIKEVAQGLIIGLKAEGIKVQTAALSENAGVDSEVVEILPV